MHLPFGIKAGALHVHFVSASVREGYLTAMSPVNYSRYSSDKKKKCSFFEYVQRVCCENGAPSQVFYSCCLHQHAEKN